MRKASVQQLTLAAMVAAVYAVLTIAIPILSYGPLQLRVSEALTVLPLLFPAAAPGLFVGCFVANLLSPYGLIDLVCGTAATGLAAILTTKMPNRWLAPLPPVLCNGLIVGGMLAWYEVGFSASFPALLAINGVWVALGEMAACYGLGLLVLSFLAKIKFLHPMMAETPF